MNVHGYVSSRYCDDVDSFELEERHQAPGNLQHDLFVAPRLKNRTSGRGVKASRAFAYVHQPVPWSVPPYTLPRALYDVPNLIDEERWEMERRKLRKQGVRLPCDYMFGHDDRMAESSCGDETIRPTAMEARNYQGSSGRPEQGQVLLHVVVGEDGLAIQNPGAVVLQLLGDFGRAIVGQLFAGR
ncbi:hypothetical protein PTMSG1_07159 [Pyrenophora teres f. maculata]|nr:hypothetical protein PTMSG1_07159 [Pyrenophora teres f. maculata]